MSEKESQQNAGKDNSITPNNSKTDYKSTVITNYSGQNFASMTNAGILTIEEVANKLLNPSEEDSAKVRELNALYNAKIEAESDSETENAKAIEEQFKAKKALYFDSVAFAGEFSGTTCRKECFVHSANLVAMDFDHLAEDTIKTIYDRLKDDSYTFLLYKTASGCGLRIVFKCPFSDEVSFNKAWAQINRYLKTTYSIESDEGTKNINRLMKLCPSDAYVNWESSEFDFLSELETINDDSNLELSSEKNSSFCKSIEPKHIPSYVSKVAVCELNKLYKDCKYGDRNTTLNKVAFKLGQYEHYNLYSMDEAYDIIHDISITIKLDESEIRSTFDSGWNSGKMNSIYLYQWEASRNA